MPRTSIRWLPMALVVAILALVAPAWTAGAATEEAAKILRVQYPDFTDIVDPRRSASTFEIGILALAYEGLTRLDANQETIPAAAESWAYNKDARGRAIAADRRKPKKR